MYVIKIINTNRIKSNGDTYLETIYSVGYYNPDGDWVPDSDYIIKSKAEDRLNYLNGGPKSFIDENNDLTY